MPIYRISICLSQIVLDNFSLTLTSFVPRCLTTWLKECVRGIHKPENVESCSVCFKFTAWVTVNTHAPRVPHITKVGKMCIRYRRVLTGPIKMGKRFLVFTPLSLSLSSLYQGGAKRDFFSCTDEFGLALSDSRAAEIVAAICVPAKTCTLGWKCGRARSRLAEKFAVSDAICNTECGRGVKCFSFSPLLPHVVPHCNPRAQVF